jgi:hypothetical protein
MTGLMLNGIEAIKNTGGVVTVKSQLCEDGQIEIAVNDTGPGLPLDKADQMFDAFFTTKPQDSGMGLANQQVDRRIAWRTDLGQRRRRPWRDVPLYLTGGSRRNKPSHGCSLIRHPAQWVAAKSASFDS